MTTRLAVISLAALALAAGTARAGFTPAWSYVPPTLRAQLASRAGGTLYLPARVATGYRYRSGAKVVNGVLTVPFTQRVRVRQGVYKWTNRNIVWRTQKLPANTACESWAPKTKTLQLSGNKVYLAGSGVAWRCVTDRTGRRLVLSSTDPTAVTSALDVSRRSNAPTVALSVSPTRVARGRAILVQGVAGGCTSGNAVTVLSRAFPATHRFAGVPAAYAQVGSAGRFSTHVTIPKIRAPGSYTITARCGGGNLGLLVHLTVTR
jgi:hypothetical protein